MVKRIEIKTWKRKEYFEFFSAFEKPSFDVVMEIKCTKAYSFSKAHGKGFFTYYIHKAIKTLNAIEEFRYRIKDDEVLLFDKIDISTTIGREDNTFGFSYIDYHEDFEVFSASVEEEVAAVRNSNGLRLRDNENKLNVVHCSAAPWINYTGLGLAQFSFKDSIPKITFGQCHEKGGELYMPASLHAHHGLVDGYHAGEYFRILEQSLNEDL